MNLLIHKGFSCFALLLAFSAPAAEGGLPPAATPPPPEAAVFAGSGNLALRNMHLGLLALENGDPARAAEFFRTALLEKGAERERSAIFDLRHESLLECGRRDEAAKLLAEAAKDPAMRDAPGLLAAMRARQAFFSGRKTEARTLLEQTLAATPAPAGETRHRLLELLALAANDLGDYAAAAKCCETLAELTGNSPFRHWRALSGAVLNALDAGNPEAAKRLLDRIEREIPEAFRRRQQGRIGWLKLLAEADGGDSAVVEARYEALLKTARVPDGLLARVAGVLARQNGEKRNWTRARSLWNEALKFSDEWYRRTALAGVLRSETECGAYQDALKTLERLRRLYPDGEERFGLLLLESSLREKLGQAEAAEKLCREVFRDSKNQDERRRAAREIARFAWRDAHPDEALTMLKFAAEHAPDAAERRSCEQRMGEWLYKLGRFGEAAARFGALTGESAGREAELAALWQVQSLYQDKKYEAAFQAVERLRNAADPALRSSGAYLRALLLERLGRTGEAIRAYLAFADAHPKKPEAATALFQAGALAQLVDSFDSAAIFRRYARTYPGEAGANALYKAHGELLAAGKTGAADAVLADLEKDYPKSRYTVGARFAAADALREKGDYRGAGAQLDEIARRHAVNHPELLAEVAFDRAVLCEQMGDGAGAVNELTRIVQQYADQPIAPRAFFMLGDIRARNNDFEPAAALFRRAGEKQPGGDFAAACAGRASDAAFGLYGLTKQDKYLKQAQSGYETLLKQPGLAPYLHLQTLYKLGRCLEAAGDRSGAVRCYGDVLYHAAAAHRAGGFYAPVWSAKALRSALEILEAELKDADPATEDECRLEAQRLLRLAQELELPGEDVGDWQEHWSRPSH